MFDLKKAIEIWRTEAATYIPSEALEELEGHLLDAVDARIEGGMKAEEAFVIATHQLGNLPTVGKEIIYESGSLPASGPQTHGMSKPWLAFAVAAAVVLLVSLVTQCFHAFMNTRYESQMEMVINPVQLGASAPIFDNKAPTTSAKPDVATEIEVIKSKNTLYKVVDALHLDRDWGVNRWEALQRVRQNVVVTRVGETEMVRVRFQDEDSPLAANVANAIASAYRERTMNLSMSRSNNELDTLQGQLKDQADKVEEARLRMLDLAERYRITPGDDQRMLREESAAATAASEVELSLIDATTDLERESLRRKLALHREVMESRRDSSMDYRRKIAEYNEAKGEYDLQSQMLVNMQETFAKVQVMLTMPTVPITIHEDAEPSMRPVRPEWGDLWLSAFYKSWPWMLALGIGGWWYSGYLQRSRQAAFLKSVIPKSVTKAEEVSWA